MKTPSAIAHHITELIEKASGKLLPGSRLAVLVKFEFPEFKPAEYDCTNLREFINKHVPSITEIRLAGADIVYGPRPQEQEQGPELDTSQERPHAKVTPQPRVDPKVWKTFASPTTTYRLFGTPDSEKLMVAGPGDAAPASPWVEIPPCPPDTHLQIARDFISTVVEEPHRELLSGTLDKPGWWVLFFSKAKQLNLAASWNVFRAQRLIRELESALSRLGIPLPHYQGDLPRKRGVSPAPGDRPGVLARRLAVGVAQRMSIAELRALMLPLGYVVDELNDR